MLLIIINNLAISNKQPYLLYLSQIWAKHYGLLADHHTETKDYGNNDNIDRDRDNIDRDRDRDSKNGDNIDENSGINK